MSTSKKADYKHWLLVLIFAAAFIVILNLKGYGLGKRAIVQRNLNRLRGFSEDGIAVGIASINEHHEGSIAAIRNTWGLAFSHLYFFTALSNDNILGVLHVQGHGHTNKLALDELAILKHLYRLHPYARWYYKIDDDSYVNSAALVQLTSNFDPRELWYIGSELQYKRSENTFQKYCAGGTGYLISNSLMRLIVSENQTEHMSDVQVGQLVQRVQGKKDSDVICYDISLHHKSTTLGNKNYEFGIGINSLTSRFNTSLKNLVVTDDVSKVLQTYLAFHHVTPVQQYILWAMYHFDLRQQAVDTGIARYGLRYTYGNKGSLADPSMDWNGVCGVNGFKCVISYGLYGNLTKYNTGAIRNAMLIDTVYPGWVARFYYDPSSVPKDTITSLNAMNNVELIPYNFSGTIAGMFARFQVAGDSTVDRFIVRDTDSRLNLREKAAVDEWIVSGYSIHILRDHPGHDRPMNGGLWGGVKGVLRNISDMIASFRDGMQLYGQDQDFLDSQVYPIVILDQISHDSYSCTKYPNSIPYPTRRIVPEHVGMVFSAYDEPRMSDLAAIYSSWVADPKCRRHPDWTKG